MKSLINLEYDKNYQYGKDFYDDDRRERLYLKKTYFKMDKSDYYFLNLYSIKDGAMLCQGYLYFCLDFQNKESKFIGVYVRDEFRNLGYASFLIANWIKLCLDNGIYNLYTNKKQRKPFTLYLLKKYYFDLKNLEEYNTSHFNIHICRGLSDNTKYLLFDNQRQKEGFSHGNIMNGDNYHIIDSLTEGIEEIDKVLLSRPHILTSENASYVKALKYIDKRTKR